MKRIPDAYWADLKNHFNGKVLATLNWALASTDPVSVTVEEICAEFDDCPSQQIRSLLDQFVRDGYLMLHEQRPCPGCHEGLSAAAVKRLRCDCGYTLQEGAIPEMVRAYVREGQRSRDVRWVITVHGMNTPGVWQQDFSWRLAKLYGYAVPVGIYKFGNIKFSPLIPYRQNYHKDRLLKYLTRLRDEMRREGYGERGDVIAHSFGTWLLAHAMQADQTDDPIKLGRVILTGSIVRPDFPWNELLKSGRIDEIMCHYSERDFPVRLAQYFIPDSGPSGRYGFNDQERIIHKLEKEFGHSDYFEEKNLDSVMAEKWAPFLTKPASDLVDWRDQPNSLRAPPWTPSRWRFLTHAVKVLFLLALAGVLILATCALWTGLPPIAGWLITLVHSYVDSVQHILKAWLLA